MNWSEYFYYDETSPSCLRWKVDRQSWRGRRTHVKVGDIAGCKMPTGHYVVRLLDRGYPVGRVILELHGYTVGDLFVDHKDGNPGNNIISNLRAVTRTLNARNRGRSKNNTSGVPGVYLKTSRGKKYWVAFWAVGGKGKQTNKTFSVEVYGNEEAFRLACECRRQKLDELNEDGYGYTERHKHS